MKKLYTLIAATAIAFSASAQRAEMNGNPLNGFTPTVKANSSRAAGDTLFYFDGNAFYGTGINQATFNYGNEDIDGKTIWTAGQGSFGTTSAYRFFYELHSVTQDTLSFIGATSYFNPIGCCADNWFEVGPITIPSAGATLNWKHNIPDGNYRDGYEVLVSNTGLDFTNYLDPAIFTVADMDPATALDTANYPENVFYPRNANLSAYAGQDVYIAFHHTANDMFILYFDDILVLEGASAVGVNEFVNGIKVAQNMPNPFNAKSVINYELNENALVTLSVYDVTGKLISAQNAGEKAAGKHSIEFNAENLSAGVYYYSIKAGENTSSAVKMVVIK